MLRKAFENSKNYYQYEIVSICVLPDHIHLIINPNNILEYPKIITSIKYYFSKNYDVGVETPTYLLGYKLNTVFQINPFNIRLIYTKGKDLYVLNYYSGNDNVDLIGHFQTKCNNPTFIYWTDKSHNNAIYAIGGLLYDYNSLNCNNIIENSINNVCNTIEEIKFKY